MPLVASFYDDVDENSDYVRGRWNPWTTEHILPEENQVPQNKYEE
jgi:hypothetical protein